MNITDRLYVEIHPYEGPRQPHPIEEGHFDPELVYKVLGVYNPSETSECYLILANPRRQIWFIPQRHVLAFGLLDSDEFFMSKGEFARRRPRTTSHRKPEHGHGYMPMPPGI